MGVEVGSERVCVRDAIWDGCRVAWPGGGRPQSKRFAAAERSDGLRLDFELTRLVVEFAGVDVCGMTAEAVEADRTNLDVEVAAV